MTKVKLVAVGRETKASQIALQLPTIIGRGRAVGLTLPHPLVSRRHCELFERDGRLCVRDLGSLNGTYVANQRVRDAEVPDGELLTVGTVTFRVTLLDSMTKPAPPESSPDGSRDLLRPAAQFNVLDLQSSSDTSDFPMRIEGAGGEPAIEHETELQPGSEPDEPSDDELRTFLDGFL